MLTLEEIRHRLQPMNLQYVSRETGLHSNIVYRLAKGNTPDPRYETVKKLSDWLEGR